MSAIIAAAGAEILIPVLKKVGAPILSNIFRNRIGGKGGEIAAQAIDVLAGRLGTDPTPEAITEAHTADPVRTETIIREVEADYGEQWLAYLNLLSADAKSDDRIQRWWRPICALLFAVTCTVLLLSVAIAILRQIPLDDSLIPLVGMVGTVIVPWAGIVGWYVKARTDEKIAGAIGQPVGK